RPRVRARRPAGAARVKRSAASWLGAALVALFALAALLGPLVAPRDPTAIDLDHEFASPSGAHLLGTADNGVDLLSALLAGARLAGLVALLVVAASLVIGTVLGAVAGMRGGAVD